MQPRHPLPLPLFLALTLLTTLSSSAPIPSDDAPPTAQKVLPPPYHVLLNLVWAVLTAGQLATALKIIKLPSLTQKNKESYRFLCAAIASRLASHLLTAAFAEFVLPNWNWKVWKETGGESSVLGTFADASSWAIDGLLFTGIFKAMHEQEPQPITFHSLMNPTHEMVDRLLLRVLWALIALLSTISFVHPGPMASGYSALLGVYGIYLAVFGALIVDCTWWSVILIERNERVKRKEAVYTLFTKIAPFLGTFLFGVWTMRCWQIPVPFFVIDISGQILVHAFVYSTVFCFVIMMGGDEKFIIHFGITFSLTLVACFYVIYVFSNVLP